MIKLADVGLRPIANRMRAQSMCKHKRRHGSQGAAEAAMRSLIQRGLHAPEAGELNVYPCPRCLGWHVGHRRQEG
jgi:hypothetical protein